METGNYKVAGPESGDFKLETITLHSDSGAKRIWKIKSMTEKEIVLEIIKFG